MIRLLNFTQILLSPTDNSLSQLQSPATCFHMPSPMRSGKERQISVFLYQPNSAYFNNLLMIFKRDFSTLKISQKEFLISCLDQLVQLRAGASVNNPCTCFHGLLLTVSQKHVSQGLKKILIL